MSMAKSQARIEELPGGDKPGGDGDKKPPSSSTRARSSKKADTDLRGRLAGCFERIAEVLAERGDEELAEIIQEDGPTISQGLVSLTRPFKVLRVPLLALVATIEPALAFGRIARVLFVRWADRRERKQMTRKADAQAVAAEHADN